MSVEKAKREVLEQLAELCREGYPELEKLKIKIGVVFAHAAVNDEGVKTGPALRRNGYEAAWKATVTKADQRLTGSPDLLVTLNGDQWEEWSEDRRESVLDEVLYAVDLVRDPETDAPLPDDAGRPRLRLKKFDIRVEGYAEIARRHKKAALVTVAIERVNERLSQQLMEWG